MRVALLLLLGVLARPALAESPSFAAGQHWSYETRSEEPGSTLIVGRVEDVPKLGQVIHVSIIDLNLIAPSGAIGHVVAHIPISADALARSVKKQLPHASQPEAFESGYAAWREAKGGVYTLTVREVVETLQRTLDAH